MRMRHPAGPTASRARGHKTFPKTRTPTRRPAVPARLRELYEDDDDTFDVPETALGAAKE